MVISSTPALSIVYPVCHLFPFPAISDLSLFRPHPCSHSHLFQIRSQPYSMHRRVVRCLSSVLYLMTEFLVILSERALVPQTDKCRCRCGKVMTGTHVVEECPELEQWRPRTRRAEWADWREALGGRAKRKKKKGLTC